MSELYFLIYLFICRNKYQMFYIFCKLNINYIVNIYLFLVSFYRCNPFEYVMISSHIDFRVYYLIYLFICRNKYKMFFIFCKLVINYVVNDDFFFLFADATLLSTWWYLHISILELTDIKTSYNMFFFFICIVDTKNLSSRI